jgi:hypothetical protein
MIAEVLAGVVGKLASATLHDLGAHDPQPAIVPRTIMGGFDGHRFVVGLTYGRGKCCTLCGLSFLDDGRPA